IFQMGEYTPLNVNFEIFIDRYIQSNGATFWEWRYYTA
ncbi:SMI1/KNR4 family protein, partial [Bacillus vallismortis]|nr:SMI1/KNR4 family protein [Bacillus vallismortis]